MPGKGKPKRESEKGEVSQGKTRSFPEEMLAYDLLLLFA
jgi:hypothetical protein